MPVTHSNLRTSSSASSPASPGKPAPTPLHERHLTHRRHLSHLGEHHFRRGDEDIRVVLVRAIGPAHAKASLYPLVSKKLSPFDPRYAPW
jgi:hypothetical protein